MTSFTVAEKEEISSHSLGISMDRWAPACWRMLNAAAFGPQCQTQWFSRLLHSLVDVIICPMCQAHFLDYLTLNPPPQDLGADVKACSAWLVDFHNDVSVRSGNPAMDLETVRSKTTAALSTGGGLQPAIDLFAFMLAVATLYRGSEQKQSMQTFIEEITNLFPVRAAADALEETPFDLASAATLFASVLAARNAWATTSGVDQPGWTLLEAIEQFAPPGLYESLGITDPTERLDLERRFQERVEGVREARKRAYDRINGTRAQPSLADYIEPASMLPSATATGTMTGTAPPKGKAWTAAQLAGLVVGLVVLVILLSVIIALAVSAWNRRSGVAAPARPIRK
jgi:hypothetical protein